MGLITKSRKFLSDFFQAHSNPKSTAIKPQAAASSTNGRDTRLIPPLIRGRAMRFINFRGQKRKRERDDGGFSRRKNRLLGGGAIKNVTEEEMREDFQSRNLLEIFYPDYASITAEAADWPEDFEEFTSEEPDDPQESFEDLTSELSCTLDNLTIIDDDDDTIMRSPYTNSETRDKVEQSWMESIPEWEDNYCLGRRRSDGSIRVTLYADWTPTDALPDDSGRRSAPPRLDVTWNLMRQLDDRPSPGNVPVVAEDIFLNALFESSLELNLEAASEFEHGMEVKGDVEETGAKAEVDAGATANVGAEKEPGLEEIKLEEADANARAEAQTESNVEAEGEAKVEAKVEETEATTEAEKANVSARVEVEMEANVEANVGTNVVAEMEPELEEAEAVAAEEEANVSARAQEETEETETKLEPQETEVEETTVAASVEEPEANRELEETEAEEANDSTEVEAQVEEAEEETGAKELHSIAGAETSEVIAEATMMQKVEATTLETVETGEPTEPQQPADELEPASELVPEPISEQALEPTFLTPEPADPTPKPALGLTFLTLDWPANQFAHIAAYEAELCSQCRQKDADIASRIRAIREKFLEELLIIEQNLRPHCSGVRV